MIDIVNFAVNFFAKLQGGKMYFFLFVCLILGIIGILSHFLYKAWKYRYDSIKGNDSNFIGKKDPNRAILEMAIVIQKDIAVMTNKYSGKYVSIEELTKYKKEVDDKIEETKKQLTDLIKEINQETSRIKKALKGQSPPPSKTKSQ